MSTYTSNSRFPFRKTYRRKYGSRSFPSRAFGARSGNSSFLRYPRTSAGSSFYRSRGPYRTHPARTPEVKDHRVFELPYAVSFNNMNGPVNWNQNTDPWHTPANPGNSNGVITPILNNVPLGTDYFQRLGTRINWNSIYLNISWQLMSSDMDTVGGYGKPTRAPVNIRVALVLDKQSNGSQGGTPYFLIPRPAPMPEFTNPSIHDIFQAYSTNAGPDGTPILEVGVLSVLNLNNRDRFKILWDYRSTLSPNGNDTRNITKYIKLKGYQSQFATGGSITTNALYLVFLSDGTRWTNNATEPVTFDSRPFATFNSRFRFTDP